MVKVCILGDSHAASLKNGLDLLDFTIKEKFDLTFFAARSLKQVGLNSLKVSSEKDRLISPIESVSKSIAYTSGGLTEIDPNLYDIFLVYGLSLRVYLEDESNLDSYSSQLVNTLFKDYFSSSRSVNLVDKLRKITSKPIFVGHNPLLANVSEVRSNYDFDYQVRLSLLKNFLDDFYHVSLIAQPDSTIINRCLTEIKYSINSTRLDVGDKASGKNHPDDDVSHMNAEFGKLFLEDFFKAVDSKRQINHI